MERRGESEGERRRNRTAITIQDYAACFSPQPSSPARLCSHTWEGERGDRDQIAGAGKHPGFSFFFFSSSLSIHPSGEEKGSSGGSIPGLPRSALGLQDRCCPGEGKRSSVQRAAVFSNSRIIVIASHREACHDFHCRVMLRGEINRGYL